MQTENTHWKAPERLILAGGCFFILVLGISTFWERDIRWLHFFQARIYVASDRFEPAEKSFGIRHWTLGRRPLGLRNRF